MTAPAAAASAPSLRANRDFVVVLTGQAVSAFGDAISLTAMPLLVLLLTGSGALMGTVAALQFVPDLVLGLPAGAIADRYDRRRLMLWSDAGRAALTMTIPITYWLGGPTIAVVLLVALPINLLRLLSDSALSAAVPGLVGRDHIGRANGLIEATLSIPFILGPAIAGVLVALINPASTIAIDAATFAFSALSLVFVRRSLRAERPAEMPSVLDDIRAGVAFVFRHSVLRAMVLLRALIQLSVTPLLPVLAFYLIIDRGYGAELFGLVGSAWSIGYLAGSIAVSRLPDGRAGLRLILCGLLMGLSLAAIALTTEPVVYLVAGGVIGFGLAIGVISFMTLRMAVTPDDMMGRVGSAARTVVIGAQPLALLTVGALTDATSGGLALLVMAAIAAGNSVLFLASRSFREARA